MSQVIVKIIILGHLPYSIDLNRLQNWKSSLFKVSEGIDSYTITENSDSENWEFSDDIMEKMLPQSGHEDFLLAITNVPLQGNYFTRKLPGNRLVLSYNSMTEILKDKNIPLENLSLRITYAIAFAYKLNGGRLPEMYQLPTFTHDETRGCIFDMNGIKSEIIYSLNKPKICNACVQQLVNNTSRSNHRIETNLVEKVKKELKKIKKDLYYRISDFVKVNPILSIFLSSFFALIFGIVGSLVATIIWERCK